MKIKISPIWNFFIAIDDSNAKCKICEKNYWHIGRSTTSLKNHLKAMHIENYVEFEKLDEAVRLSSITENQLEIEKNISAHIKDESSSNQNITEIYASGGLFESNSESEISPQSELSQNSSSTIQHNSTLTSIKQRQSDPPKIQQRKSPGKINKYSSHQNQVIEKEDESYIFGKLVINKLRKLSEERRDWMMINIIQLFIDEQKSHVRLFQ